MAISKKRLQELINQGAIIYGIFRRKVRTIDLKDLYSISKNGKILVTEYIDLENFKIKTIFETKEEAEWYKEFGCIERVERLKLPTWEEIKHEFIDKNYLMNGDYTIIDIPDLILDIRVDIIPQIFIYSMEEKYNWNLTKENYTLACRKAKELFLKGDK